MKEGDTVVLLGLLNAGHLNGKIASVIDKDAENDRWVVEIVDRNVFKVDLHLFVLSVRFGSNYFDSRFYRSSEKT
jgi:hypothetical protein